MNKKSANGFTLIEVMIVVVIIALLAFMAVPAYNKVKQNSKNNEILKNLKVIASAGKEFMLENDATDVGYASLEGKYFPAMKPVAGENYTPLVVSNSGGTLSISQDNGSIITLDY